MVKLLNLYIFVKITGKSTFRTRKAHYYFEIDLA